MHRFLSASTLLLLLSSACASDAYDPGQGAGRGGKADSLEPTDSEMVALSVEARWTGAFDEPTPLPEGIEFDDFEGEFTTSTVVELGPLSECAKPFSERVDSAVCSWSGPSSLWDMGLFLSREGIVDLSVSAGDADSTGSTSLPLESIPERAPWTFSFSPDNAGGAFGFIRMQVQREAALTGQLGCQDLRFSSVDDIEFEGEFDTYVECWLDDTLCWEGDKDEAAGMLADLFEVVWDGTRTLDDLNSESGSIVLFSTDDNGDEEVLTVAACE